MITKTQLDAQFAPIAQTVPLIDYSDSQIFTNISNTGTALSNSAVNISNMSSSIQWSPTTYNDINMPKQIANMYYMFYQVTNVFNKIDFPYDNYTSFLQICEKIEDTSIWLIDNKVTSDMHIEHLLTHNIKYIEDWRTKLSGMRKSFNLDEYMLNKIH